MTDVDGAPSSLSWFHAGENKLLPRYNQIQVSQGPTEGSLVDQDTAYLSSVLTAVALVGLGHRCA